MRDRVNRLNRQDKHREDKPQFMNNTVDKTTLNLSERASWENMLNVRVEKQTCHALVDKRCTPFHNLRWAVVKNSKETGEIR